MPIPGLSETLIQQRANAQSFERGLDYYDYGAVAEIIKRGDRVQGIVEGGQYEPYRVSVTWDAGGITSAYCSCPYDWGGWCKHIVAVLLTVLHDEDTIEERVPVEDLLADFTREQLQQLVLRLAERSPSMVDEIEAQLAMLRPEEPAPAQATSRKTSIDPAPIRRQVHAILHSLDRMRASEAYWHISGVVGEIYALVERARDFLDGGDAYNALVILDAVTDEYVQEWYYLDDSDGEASGLFYELGPVWAEAVLMAELKDADRNDLSRKLQRWQSEIDDYGVDPVFDAAQSALTRGWDAEALARFFAGAPDDTVWDDDVWFEDELVEAGLNVLERQGKYDTFLELADATGRTGRYLNALAEQGMIDRAVSEGLARVRFSGDALALARLLRQHEHLDEALTIAEHGLTLVERRLDADQPPRVPASPFAAFQYVSVGNDAELAAWLRDFARGLERTGLAQRAAEVAFRIAPTLENYVNVEELTSPADWPALKTDLLDTLRESTRSRQGIIEVFIHEGLIDDAIAALGQYPYYAYVQPVMDAAIERKQRPDWIIDEARRQAEEIMDAGKSGAYRHAVEWLKRARAGYRIAGREDEWRRYLASLIEKHTRKWKLRPMLEALRD